MPVLTAGEECQQAARSLSAFTGTGGPGTGIPKNFITMAMALAIVRGGAGVAVVRLKTGEWSAPCAIMLENPNGKILPDQDTALLFMSENSVLALVARTRLILNTTHRFAPGPLVGNPIIDGSNDVYAYVRYNNNFTPANLVLENMAGWGMREDMERHERWHGADVTWADVLMNKITVDRSSIGNALYLVINIAAGGSSTGVFEMNGRKNFANLDKLAVRQGLDGPVSAGGSASSSPSIPAQANLAVQQEQQQMMNMQSVQQMQITPQVLQQLQQMPPQQAQMIFQQLTPLQLQQVQQLQMLQAQAQTMGGGGIQQLQYPQQPQSHSPSIPTISTLMTSHSQSYASPVQTPSSSSVAQFESPEVFMKRQNELLQQQQMYQMQREQAEEMTRRLEAQSKQLELQRAALEREQEAIRMGVLPQSGRGGSAGNVQAFGGFHRQ
ncbi:hypothetical protein HDU67_001752 [Dinochytrium kinnereticum]|nr:hypothetical protein HDU67_001752 [Dinochytrium kinnereticum]